MEVRNVPLKVDSQNVEVLLWTAKVLPTQRADTDKGLLVFLSPSWPPVRSALIEAF